MVEFLGLAAWLGIAVLAGVTGFAISCLIETRKFRQEVATRRSLQLVRVEYSSKNSHHDRIAA